MSDRTTDGPGDAHRREVSRWFLLLVLGFIAYGTWLGALADRCSDRGGQPGVFLPTCGVMR